MKKCGGCCVGSVLERRHEDCCIDSRQHRFDSGAFFFVTAEVVL